jgi:dTDP-4-amino-4,6-dideoxygalactose transaminase
MIKIPLFKVYMNPFVDEDVLQVLHSGYIGQGNKVEQFEKALSTKIKNRHCLSLAAGTHGLHLALRLIGVKAGDTVITSSLTCTATNWPILMQGADIIWADIQTDSLNIDPNSIRERIQNNTKAIMCMHWGGYPCDMEEIYNIGKEFSIPIIEDAAHAFGATYKDSIIGDCAYSDYTMFSFQAIKLLTSVDGGALFLKDAEDYRRGKLLRWYGINREGLRRDIRCEDFINEYGYKYHMNDVCATIGLKNLERIPNLQSIIKDNVEYYRSELTNFSGVTLLQNKVDRVSSNWLFTMLVEERTSFANKMGEIGVHISRVHERNDIHPCVKKYAVPLPILDSIIDRMICIPCGWWVSKEDREYIIDAIKKGW